MHEDHDSESAPTAADTPADSTVGSAAGSAAPVEFGPYRLLSKIGEGGMGEVWAAEQQFPVRRRVALKIIKRGMDTKQVTARFEVERQALALMNHPNVARVFDAGETPGGRPYFAMEFVKGNQITEYCDRSRLTTRERLELMIQVCDGVQHAHQKGVIHRDLKPSNILVSVEDESSPTPKIIDFGVAKATNQHLTERTLFTEMGQLIGTPEYMSPEQAEMTGIDIDTRSDVYSLGVVLYQLLTGALPFEPDELRSAGLIEIQRKIREDEPPRPSTRVSSLGDDSNQVAHRRRTESRRLVHRLKGDLDWITMKAMEKDRLRRYASPNDLAADLRRHLNDEPVLAASPSAAYRMRKFAVRHKSGVVAAFVLSVALVIGVAGLAVGLLRATNAEHQAVAERDRAAQTSEELGEVVDFLVDLFEVADPEMTRGEAMTAREILDRGAERLQTELRDRPVTRARLLETIGDVYQSLGLYEIAYGQKVESLEILRRETGDESVDVARSLLSLSSLEGRRANAGASERTAREALGIFRAAYPGDHVDVSRAVRALALAVSRGGRDGEAEPLYREALAMARRLPDISPRTLEAQVRGLANVLNQMENEDEAESLYRESLELCQSIWGGDHTQVAYAIDNLAIHYDYAGQLERAEPLYREALAMLRRVYGPEHPEVAQTMGNLASFLVANAEPGEPDLENRLAEAESLATTAIDMHRRFFPDHPMIADNYTNLADLEAFRENHELSERHSREALRIYRKKLDDGHPKIVEERMSLAEAILDQGRAADAVAILRDIYDGLDDRAFLGTPRETLELLIEANEQLDRTEQAETYRALLRDMPESGVE